jgi:hypothetical protein
MVCEIWEIWGALIEKLTNYPRNRPWRPKGL